MEYSRRFHDFPWPSMTFHGFLWDKFSDIPELSIVFHNLPEFSIMFHNVLWHSMAFHKVPWTSIWPSVHIWGSLRFPVGYPEAKWSFWDIIHKSLWLSQGSASYSFADVLKSMNSAWSLLAVFRAWGYEYCLRVTRVPLRSLSIIWGYNAWWLLNQVFPDLVRFFSHSQFLQCASHFLLIFTYAAAMLNNGQNYDSQNAQK